ncbi:hypothetical protein D3C86_1523980 [compost metagenome]
MRDSRSNHQHHLAAHDVQGEWQDESFRQHPEQPEQTHQLRGMQRSRIAPILPGQQQERGDEHRVRKLDQAHPGTVQGRPSDLRQPHQQRLRVTLLQPQRHAAHRQQHGETRHHVLEQVRALLPRGEHAKQQRQQQATQMEDHRGVLAHLAVVAVVVGLCVEQKVGDVHGDHQKQFTLTSVNRAVGTAEQQHQGRQYVEQRGEENVQVFDIRGRKARQ